MTFEGDPLVATRALMRVNVMAVDKDADVAGLIRRARETSTVSNSIARGISVETVSREGLDD